jgi:hypothetical protein
MNFLLFILLAQQAPWWGQVLTSDHGRIGQSEVSQGTTVYDGDDLSTPEKGSLQVRPRSGCARLLLLPATSAKIQEKDEAVQLIYGIVTFTTSSKKCLKAIAGKLAVKPKEDKPTMAQVIYVLMNKEAIVIARQGSLVASIDGEEKIINEGECYRVVFEPVPVPVQEQPAGATGGIPGQGGPKKAGMSHFLLTAMAFISIATGFGISEALESPPRP